MVIRISRCLHCGNRYGYQASGTGCGRAENDPLYCPICKKAQNDALHEISRRFEGRYQNVRDLPAFSDITSEMMLAWERDEEDDREQRRNDGQLVAVRVFPGLIRLETGECQRIREVAAQDGPHKGTRFKVASWPNDTEVEVAILREYDLAEMRFTGRPWP